MHLNRFRSAVFACAWLGLAAFAASVADSTSGAAQAAVVGREDPGVVVVVAGKPAKDTAAIGGELRMPFGADADRAGHLFIVEMTGYQVRKLEPRGRLSVIAGTGEKGAEGDGGAASSARFNGMHNLAVAPNGDLFIADTWNCRVRKIDVKTGVVTTVAGTGVKGYSGDGGPARNAQCGDVYCVSLDAPRNRLLLADLDNRRIRAVSLSDGKIDTLAGNGQRGVPADETLAKESPLVDPRAVACDAAGNVYILERSGHALRVVDSQGHIRTVAGTGRMGPAADETAAAKATFNGPKHLCVDRRGDVIVADAENHVIRKLLVREKRVIRWVGSGKQGSAGVGGPAGSVELDRPHGVFVDPQGTLFIADSGNDRILKVERPARARPRAAQLDPDPGPTQKPYSPADGQLVEVTPPPFLWVPAKKESVYVLQISPSQAFPAENTRSYRNLRRPVFVPQDPLAPGRWFWRYGIEAGGKAEFGRPRPFTVSDKARPFPFPNWDEVLNRVPRERPRLFFSGERLKQVREWAKGDLKGPIASLVAACEKEVGRELVAEPGYRPKGADYGPWAINVMRTTRPPMDVMERCALAYLITGNRRLGEEAKRRIQHFFSWDPNGPTSFFAYDEPPMWMMMRGTRAYDWTYDLFAPNERTRIEANMKSRAEQFLKHLQRLPFESSPYDSHAGRLPGFLGECALSFIHEWPEARSWLDYATLLYYTSYPAWGGDDGGWQEGPGYWGAYMQFALHYVVALRAATGVDLIEKPFFRNTPYYGLYTATPYHQHSPFGDGQTGSPRGLGHLMYVFSTLTQNPYFRWHAEESGVTIGADVLSLATYDPKLKARSPRELPQARSFPAVGLASFHTALGDKQNDISFLMRSSPYGGVSHGHADQNAYVIEAFGRGLAIATGYYPWYGSPHHDQWTRATKAVNSILVDGQGQVQRRWGAGGELTAFESVDGYDYAEAEASRAYPGRLERFRRHAVHLRPGVFVLLDDLKSPESGRFQWLLHARNRIQAAEGSRVLRITNTPAAMEVHLLLPEKLDFTQTDKYEPEPESIAGKWTNTWHLTASTASQSRQANFLAVLLPSREGQQSSLPKVELLHGAGAVGVSLTAANGARDIVAFRTGTGTKTVACGGIESAGRVFAQGKDRDGRVVRHYTRP